MNKLQNTTDPYADIQQEMEKIDWSDRPLASVLEDSLESLPDPDKEETAFGKKEFLQRWERAIQYQYICQALQDIAENYAAHSKMFGKPGTEVSLVLGWLATRTELDTAFGDKTGIGFNGQCLADFFRSGKLAIYYVANDEEEGATARLGQHIDCGLDSCPFIRREFSVEWDGDPSKAITIQANDLN
jgi:hypothetical protein